MNKIEIVSVELSQSEWPVLGITFMVDGKEEWKGMRPHHLLEAIQEYQEKYAVSALPLIPEICNKTEQS